MHNPGDAARYGHASQSLYVEGEAFDRVLWVSVLCLGCHAGRNIGLFAHACQGIFSAALLRSLDGAPLRVIRGSRRPAAQSYMAGHWGHPEFSLQRIIHAVPVPRAPRLLDGDQMPPRRRLVKRKQARIFTTETVRRGEGSNFLLFSSPSHRLTVSVVKVLACFRRVVPWPGLPDQGCPSQLPFDRCAPPPHKLQTPATTLPPLLLRAFSSFAVFSGRMKVTQSPDNPQATESKFRARGASRADGARRCSR